MIETKTKNYGWMLPFLSTMFVFAAFTACSSGEEDDSIPKEVIVDKKPDTPMELNSNEEMIINEGNCIVNVEGCTIEINPCIIEGDTKLTVSKTTQAPWMINEDDKVTAVNVKVGDLSEFNGVVKIHIPVNFGPGKLLIGAQWNETTNDWEPALCEYDKKKGEAIIWTDTPGTFGVTVVSGSAIGGTRAGENNKTFGAFIVARANTRDAGLYANKFHYIDWEDPPLLVFSALKSKLFGGENSITKVGDVISQDILDTKALFGDITYPLMQELELGTPLLDKTCDFMGELAVVATFYQKLRATYYGEVDKADAMELKSLLDWGTETTKRIFSTSAMNVGMVAVAIFDYTLNKFAEEAWKGRKDMYKKAFEFYYSKGEDGYRSFRQWYDLFWPAFIKEGMTEYRLSTLIDAYVNQYCDQFWENESRIAYYMEEATGAKWTGGGGLNDNIKKEVSGDYREYLYGDTSKLPKVFDAIGEKLMKKQCDLMKDRMMKYAYHMNEMVTLHFKDVSVADGNSAFAGHTVKFKRMPLSIIDPEKWTCELNDKGEGDIKFRLFGYVAAGVRPEMVILSPEGKEVLTLNVENIDVGNNVITFDGGSQEKVDVNPNELNFEAEGGTDATVKITKGSYKYCDVDDIATPYNTWLSAKCGPDGIVTIEAKPNTTTEKREGKINCWVSNKENPGDADKKYIGSITVIQEAGDGNSLLSTTSLEFPVEGGAKFIGYNFGTYLWMKRNWDDDTWLRTAWSKDYLNNISYNPSSDNRFANQLYVCCFPNETGKEREQAITFSYSMIKGFDFDTGDKFPVKIKQEGGSFNMEMMKNFFVGTWYTPQDITYSNGNYYHRRYTFRSDNTFTFEGQTTKSTSKPSSWEVEVNSTYSILNYEVKGECVKVYIKIPGNDGVWYKGLIERWPHFIFFAYENTDGSLTHGVYMEPE